MVSGSPTTTYSEPRCSKAVLAVLAPIESVSSPTTQRSMVSHNGIVGHQMHRVREFEYPWPAGAMLVDREGHQYTRHTIGFHAPDQADAGLLAR